MAQLLPTKVDTASINDIKGMAEIIYRSARDVYTLLENLLEWARMQIEGIEYQPNCLNLQQIVKYNIQLFSTNAKEKGITLQNQIPHDLFVYADKNMLDTVLCNLISNGIKFTADGGTVAISAKKGISRDLYLSETDIFTEITVFDTGVGISKLDQEKLFTIRGHHTTIGTGKEVGTGLGLIICKEMVERNGGRIWVESELGQGTAFKFTVPMQNMKKKYWF